MKPRSMIIVAGSVIFLGVLVYALLREVEREESTLATSISGRVEVGQGLLASGQVDIKRTDRLVLMLVDPQTGEAVAVRTESPVSPPQTIVIGQQDARDGRILYGAYTVIAFTDKDGEMYRVTPGEVFGRSPHPIELGTEGIRLILNEPFRGQAPRMSTETVPRGSRWGTLPIRSPLMAQMDNPCSERTMRANRTMIRGVLNVKPEFTQYISPGDRLFARLFIPGEPGFTRILHLGILALPYEFRLGPQKNMSGNVARDAFFVEFLTDKDDDFYSIVAGELAAVSREAIPLGSQGIVMELDRLRE